MNQLNDFLKSNIRIYPNTLLEEKELIEILAACSSFVNDWGDHEIKQYFQKRYSDFSLTLDCLIYWNITLTQVLFRKCPEFTRDCNLSNLGYFNHILITLTNNLISIKFLFENGLDTQARMVFRHSVELADLAIVVLHDKPFFLSHSSPRSGKQGNPFLSPKNNTVAEKAKQIMASFHERDGQKTPGSKASDQFWKILRSNQYEVLSELSHGNFLSNILSSYKVSEESGNYIPAVPFFKRLIMFLR